MFPIVAAWRRSIWLRCGAGGISRLSILLIACDGAFAGELWSWHAFDAKVINTRRLELTLHGRFRARWAVTDIQQGRAGVVTGFKTGLNIKAIAGYYYGKEEDGAVDWRNFHRVFGGAEVPIYRSKEFSLATRGLVERFLVSERPGFTRYRHRLRLSTEKRVGPYVAGEWFFDAQGWLSGRYAAGIRWRRDQATSLEMGYLYDQRRPSVGESRHVIVTQFSWERARHE